MSSCLEKAVILVTVIILLCYCIFHKKENYKSCCWLGCTDNCENQPEMRSLAKLNPFVYPYSATECPEDIAPDYRSATI